MGRASEELKALNKRFKEEKRFHLVKFKSGQMISPGWVMYYPHRRYYTSERVEALLSQVERKHRTLGEGGKCDRAAWYMYLGQKPEPKWGPLCP